MSKKKPKQKKNPGDKKRKALAKQTNKGPKKK